jgi:hypothetical protein
LQISVLDNVGEVIGDNGLEKAEVGKGSGTTFKISLLCTLEELRTTTSSEKNSISISL